MSTPAPLRIAIACGGTGGHLFPGLAVAEQLVARGCVVTLLVSPKEVDQQAVKLAKGMEVVTLPAVGLSQGKRLAFFRGFLQSRQAAKRYFKTFRPDAALAMGGFTSAPPILAAKSAGARTFLHESNTIPGRANRWLSWVIDQAFVGFPQASAQLHTRNVKATGTPVRPQFRSRDAASCRKALGLDPTKPVLLVTGGSQGASGINELIVRALPTLASALPELQLFLLTGPADLEKVRQAGAATSLKTVVHPFFAEMDLALGAATVAISRAGASSLAELAAVRVPSVLIPFPAATDNHQFHNAQAFEQTGAARLLDQKSASPELLARLIEELIRDAATLEKMRAALARWDARNAAAQIAETILTDVQREKERLAQAHAGHDCCSCGHDHQSRAGVSPARADAVGANDLRLRQGRRDARPTLAA